MSEPTKKDLRRAIMRIVDGGGRRSMGKLRRQELIRIHHHLEGYPSTVRKSELRREVRRIVALSPERTKEFQKRELERIYREVRRVESSSEPEVPEVG